MEAGGKILGRIDIHTVHTLYTLDSQGTKNGVEKWFCLHLDSKLPPHLSVHFVIWYDKLFG
jgi:hypothetical protein